MGRSRSTSLALPRPSTKYEPQPLCLPGLDFRCSGLPGGSVPSCGKLMEGTHPEQHTAGAPDLFISILWTFTSQQQRWPMTILGAAALSGINTGGCGSLEQASSSDSEDQGRLLGGGGLGRKGRSSAAVRSRSPYPLRLHESGLPLVPEKPKPVLPKPLYVLPRAGQWGPGEKSDTGLAPRSDSLAGKMGSHSVGSYHQHQKCPPHFLLNQSPDFRQSPT